MNGDAKSYFVAIVASGLENCDEATESLTLIILLPEGLCASTVLTNVYPSALHAAEDTWVMSTGSRPTYQSI